MSGAIRHRPQADQARQLNVAGIAQDIVSLPDHNRGLLGGNVQSLQYGLGFLVLLQVDPAMRNTVPAGELS